MPHSRDILERTPFREMTKGQRIAATKLGITPGVRSERERQLRARYGLTLEDYDELFRLGEGTCWICRQVWDRLLYVDHCHVTDEVRGLLCAECNTFLGILERSPERAVFAFMYLYPKLFTAVQAEAYVHTNKN